MKGWQAFLIVFLCSFCRQGTTDELTFLNPLLVGGLQRPTTPDGLTSTYNASLSTLCLSWNPSIDPDTQSEVPVYRLYLYYVYPPTEFFRSEDRLDELVGREYCIDTDSYTGMLTFVVTGYDGLAESLPSEPHAAVIP